MNLHRVVLLASGCDLKCLRCSVWGAIPKSGRSKKSVRYCRRIPGVGRFLNWIVRQRRDWFCLVVHVIGGDPIGNHRFGRLVRRLKRIPNCKVRVWSHGLEMPSDDVIAMLDGVYLYFPAHHPTVYREITGFDRYHESLQSLAEWKQRVNFAALVFPVFPETLSLAPQVREIAYRNNVPLILTYFRFDPFSQQSRAYVDRFYNVHNVFILPTSSPRQGICLGVPTALSDTKILIKNRAYDILNAFWKRIG